VGGNSLKKSVELGDGDTFHGEGILAVTKALLQSGVSYVGGYQGAPVSHLLDVMVRPRLPDKTSACTSKPASEASRRRHLAPRSIPGARRGDLEIDRRHQRGGRAVPESAGVMGGTLIARRGLRRGRRRRAGAQPRLRAEIHDVAARSAAEPLDHVDMVEKGFQLPASNTPVMELRIRACRKRIF
jgi:indolepyruvate ferredoxin oxidoreductase alpha subunit